MHIGFNKYQTFGKMIVLMIMFLILGLLFFTLIRSWNSDGTFFSTPTPIPAAILLILLYTFLLFMTILMTLQLILLPKGVTINEINDSIKLEFFLFRPEIITIKDIREYSTIIIITRSSRYNGIFVKLKNGKGIIFADFNLRDSTPIKEFLGKSNVIFSGHDSKFSFISFFKNNYKRNNCG